MSLFVIMVIWLMAINSSRMAAESSSIYRDKEVGKLNRVHLKFAVSHVSCLILTYSTRVIT